MLIFRKKLFAMNKRKIIVTGFGPFNEHTINASWEAVRLLPELLAETDFELIIEEIPVTYKDVDERIKILWEIHSPWVMVSKNNRQML